MALPTRSNIDPSKPASGNFLSQDVRDNFFNAMREINLLFLQAQAVLDPVIIFASLDSNVITLVPDTSLYPYQITAGGDLVYIRSY